MTRYFEIHRNLSIDEWGALREWAILHGRSWKSKLRDAWMTGNYGGFENSNFLQQIRNRLGPAWLQSFVFTTV